MKKLWVIASIGALLLAAAGIFALSRPASNVPMQPAVMALSATTTAPASTKSVSTTAPATATSTHVSIPPPPPKPIFTVPAPIVSAPVPARTPAPTPALATTTSAPVPPSSGTALPPEIAIDPRTLVGILCFYNPVYTTDQPGVTVSGVTQEEVRGSGIIVNSQGDILTNRHIVKQDRTSVTIPDDNGNQIPFTVDHQLDHCEVGQLPVGATLPTEAEIKSINPFVQVPVLGYTARPVYMSPFGNPLSSSEGDTADFAILRITGVTKQGPTFGVTSVPSVFPFAKLLPVKPYDMTGRTVITYGFPGDVTMGQGNAFETLTMTGSVGHITAVGAGDRYYAGTPLTIDTDLEVSHGRSGSPLFWRGYVVGLITFFMADNRTDSGSVASDAMLQALRSNGFIRNN